jgi:hypothetical protein
VFEDARAEKWRQHPTGIERRNFGRFNCRNWRGDRRCGHVVLAIAGRHERNSAFVLTLIPVWMHPLMQLWRSAQRDAPEKRRGNKTGDKSAHDRAASHRGRASLQLTRSATFFCQDYLRNSGGRAKRAINASISPASLGRNLNTTLQPDELAEVSGVRRGAGQI